jgi:preprotein translocase subunit SecA
MPGRRWSEGLHQAMEAKEGVSIQNENQTLASITFQNFFRIYDKLSGMTGTADTEAFEFQQIYNLEVVVIPTNVTMKRIDEPDLIYLTIQEKFQAIIEDVKDALERKQPVLVGTASIESSEFLSNSLKKANIKHQVLNAKFHEQEAQIIAEAGRPGAVTIATNMAGRGTDIVLGGNLSAELAQLPEGATDKDKEAAKITWEKNHEAVVASGGLRIIGSERHESRRIDNQLRGRAGRQGDPGSSRFYLSLDDNLMRIFASERMAVLMRRIGVKEGEPLEHNMLTKVIENAQRKLEGHNFDIRKQLLDYDNVANDQRKVIYAQRAEVMAIDDPHESVETIRADVLNALVDSYIPPESMEDQWDIQTLERVLADDFRLKAPIEEWIEADHAILPDQIKDKIIALSTEQFKQRENELGRDVLGQFEKSVILQTMDNHWREHLASMDHLRQGIHLRGYAQKDPKQEYKREAFTLFSMMLNSMRYEMIRLLSTVEIQTEQDVDAVEEQRRTEQNFKMEFNHEHGGFVDESAQQDNVTFKRESKKVGRNEPCPCGSGKKFKSCHGKI